jgi:hypothetical protein
VDRFGWGLELNLFIALSHTTCPYQASRQHQTRGPTAVNECLNTRFSSAVIALEPDRVRLREGGQLGGR